MGVFRDIVSVVPDIFHKDGAIYDKPERGKDLWFGKQVVIVLWMIRTARICKMVELVKRKHVRHLDSDRIYRYCFIIVYNESIHFIFPRRRNATPKTLPGWRNNLFKHQAAGVSSESNPEESSPESTLFESRNCLVDPEGAWESWERAISKREMMDWFRLLPHILAASSIFWTSDIGRWMVVRWNTFIGYRPGSIQFIINYYELNCRQPYKSDYMFCQAIPWIGWFWKGNFDLWRNHIRAVCIDLFHYPYVFLAYIKLTKSEHW